MGERERAEEQEKPLKNEIFMAFGSAFSSAQKIIIFVDSSCDVALRVCRASAVVVDAIQFFSAKFE
jgi:hypothetical protein